MLLLAKFKQKRAKNLSMTYFMFMTSNVFIAADASSLFKGPTIKYVRSGGGRGGQAKSIRVIQNCAFSLLKKRTRGKSGPKIAQFERTYFMDGP